MKTLTRRKTPRWLILAPVLSAGCAGAQTVPARAADVVIRSPASLPRPPFRFSAADQALLDEIQHGAFLFLWHESSATTGMVVDRSSATDVSIAGVGFQLAALPVGVERGWVKRDEALDRALLILASLESNPRARKFGLFHHFLDGNNADPLPRDAVSTIDSALFFAGSLVAASYFGGEVRQRADRLFGDADWTKFVEASPRTYEPHMKGFLSLGFKPDDPEKPDGSGRLLPFYWADNGDEHRLVAFLAGAAPEASHRADPRLYYRMRRPLGDYAGVPPHVYLPWSGALFTNFFAHCFINYAAMGPDDPALFGVERRPQVDWWENSRRAVMLHRAKATEAKERFPNFGEHAWGLSASDGPKGYMVPGVYPRPIVPGDYQLDIDYPNFAPEDDFGGGVLAPYAAGSAILFCPEDALRALRHYRGLMDDSARPLVWRAPGAREYGFRDAFDATAGWVAPDYVAIDQGPLVLAIENARTGLIWSLFHSHPSVKAAAERLGWQLRQSR